MFYTFSPLETNPLNGCLCSRRFLWRRPDVRSADAALRHPRQLLPRQHDSTQGQPGRSHHSLARSHVTHTALASSPITSPPLYWTLTHPNTWWNRGDVDQVFFYSWTPLVGLHFVWNLLLSQSAYLKVRLVNTHLNSTVVFGFNLRCVRLVLSSQHIPMVF